MQTKGKVTCLPKKKKGKVTYPISLCMLDGMSINIICPIMNIELASITNFNVIKCKINLWLRMLEGFPSIQKSWDQLSRLFCTL